MIKTWKGKETLETREKTVNKRQQKSGSLFSKDETKAVFQRS